MQFERDKSSHEIERVKTATEALEKLVQSPEFRDRLERSRSSSDLRDFIKERSRTSAELVLPPAAEETRSETGAAPEIATAASPEGLPSDSAAAPEAAATAADAEEPAALPEGAAEQQPTEIQAGDGDQPLALQAGEQPTEVVAGDEPTVLQVGPEPATTEAEQPQPAIDQETGEGIAPPAGNILLLVLYNYINVCTFDVVDANSQYEYFIWANVAESAVPSGEPEVKVESGAESGEAQPESGAPAGAATEETQKSAPAVPGSPERPTQPVEQPQQEPPAPGAEAKVKVEVEVEEEERPVVPSPMQSEQEADAPETPETPDSVFDPNRLTLEQFRTLIENFLGNEPSLVIFKQLAAFFRTAYFETEEERKTRLIEVRSIAISFT